MDGRPLSLQVADVSVTERRHTSAITGLATLGRRLFTAGADMRVLSYAGLSRGPMRFAGPELQADSSLTCLEAARCQDPGRALLAAGCKKDGDVRLWDFGLDWGRAPSGALAPEGPGLAEGPAQPNESRLVGHVMSVRSISLNQARFVALSASLDSTVRLWDLESAQEVLSMWHPDAVTRALFFPGSTQVASVCLDGCLRNWDLRVSATSPICVIEDPEVHGRDPRKELASGGLAVEAGGLLAKADALGGVRLFDPGRCGAKCLKKFRLPSAVSSLQFVLGSRYLACGCRDGELYVVRLRDLAAQAFRVQAGPTPAAITELKSTVVRELPAAGKGFRGKGGRGAATDRQVLIFTLARKGWGLGILEEGPEEVALSPLAPDDGDASDGEQGGPPGAGAA